MFLRVQNPVSPTSFIVLNVVSDSFTEDWEWKGESEPAYDNTRLSTLRDPKRVWSCTAEFLTTAALHAFRIFVATVVDVLTGRIVGQKHVDLLSDAGQAFVAATLVRVEVEIGKATAHEWNGVIGWQVELRFLEV